MAISQYPARSQESHGENVTAFPRLPRPRWGLAMTNLLTLRHRIRAAKPTACKAVTDRRYRRNWFVRFIGTLYELEVPSRDCHGPVGASQ